MLPVGTLANAAAIIVGSLIGFLLGKRFTEGIRNIVFQGLGLATLAIGIQMALKFQNPLVIIFSILIGGIVGEIIGLEDWLERLGRRIKETLKSKNESFTDGFISASLLFCIGSMAIVGSFDEGLRGDSSILLTKSILDGFASIALAATYGLGVLFSFVPILLYQSGLTFFAAGSKDFLSPLMINELTALGGLLIVGIAFNLLNIKEIKIGNLLPSLVVLVILVTLFPQFQG